MNTCAHTVWKAWLHTKQSRLSNPTLNYIIWIQLLGKMFQIWSHLRLLAFFTNLRKTNQKPKNQWVCVLYEASAWKKGRLECPCNLESAQSGMHTYHWFLEGTILVYPFTSKKVYLIVTPFAPVLPWNVSWDLHHTCEDNDQHLFWLRYPIVRLLTSLISLTLKWTELMGFLRSLSSMRARMSEVSSSPESMESSARHTVRRHN